jgi:hypothetical protein
LATRSAFSFQRVQKHETGVNRLGASRLHDMANLLRVPPKFFFEGFPVIGELAQGRSRIGLTGLFRRIETLFCLATILLRHGF